MMANLFTQDYCGATQWMGAGKLQNDKKAPYMLDKKKGLIQLVCYITSLLKSRQLCLSIRPRSLYLLALNSCGHHSPILYMKEQHTHAFCVQLTFIVNFLLLSVNFYYSMQVSKIEKDSFGIFLVTHMLSCITSLVSCL